MARNPNAADTHVGQRVRDRRKEVGLSQDALARSIGLTFQQIQKYERGSNRISASVLFHIARTLGVSVGYFYEGLDPGEDTSSGDREARVFAFLVTPEGLELAHAFSRLPPARRKGVLAMIRSIVGDADGG